MLIVARDSEPGFVLDASAVLAYSQNEPGAPVVASILPRSLISSLNWSEVVQKALASGADADGLRRDLEALGLEVVPFAADDAELAARLWLRAPDLSLADRACLALALRVGLPAVTCDRAWGSVDAGVDVQLIR